MSSVSQADAISTAVNKALAGQKVPLGRRLKTAAVARFVKAPLKAVAVGAGTGVLLLLKEATVGKSRRFFVPVWFAGTAALPIAWAWAAWLTVAVALFAGRWAPKRASLSKWVRWAIPRRKRISRKEADLTACVSVGVAIWQAWRPLAPTRTSWAVFALILTPGAILWVKSRWVRREPLPVVWDKVVVPTFPECEGKWRDLGPDGGILRLATGLGSKVAQMDEEIEGALDRGTTWNLPQGALTITHDPSLPSVRDVRVFLTMQPKKAVSRINYFDGPTLRPDGTFIAGYTIHGTPVMGRLWRDGGAVCSVLLGGPGSGKGAGTTTTGVEAAASEHVFTAAADCKGLEEGGAGIPELRTGMDVYGRTAEQWQAIIMMAHEVMGARARRYGIEGRSRWSLSTGDPIFLAIVDEIKRLMDRFPKLKQPLEEVSGLGRAFGVGVTVNTQRGQGAELVSTLFRGNIRSNGCAYLGTPGDIQAKIASTQDWSIDLSQLPSKEGWMFALSKIDVLPQEPFRWRYLPSRLERDEEGKDAPYGVVEEWLTEDRVQRAVLHPEDQEIVDKYLAMFWPDSGPAKAVDCVADFLTAAGVDLSTVASSFEASALDRELRDLVASETDGPETADGGERVLKVLKEAGAPLRLQEIADKAALSRRQVTNWLNRYKDATPPAVERVNEGWRAA